MFVNVRHDGHKDRRLYELKFTGLALMCYR